MINHCSIKNDKDEDTPMNCKINMVYFAEAQKVYEKNRQNKMARWFKIFTAETKQELLAIVKEVLMENNDKEKLISEQEYYSQDEEMINLCFRISRRTGA